jgi:hypothetical protein
VSINADSCKCFSQLSEYGIAQNAGMFTSQDYTYYLEKEIKHVDHTTPGEKVTGQVAFEIPQSATPAKLVYNDYYDYYNHATTNL